MKFLGKVDSKGFNLDGDLLITISVSNKSTANEVRALADGSTYKIDIKECNSRTLQQNAYLWRIIAAISKKQMQDDEDTYLTLLKAANAKYEYIGAIPKAVPALKEVFRVVELIDEREQMNVYKCYSGSSKMTTKEFNELLDIAIKWAYDLGIDVEAYRYGEGDVELWRIKN